MMKRIRAIVRSTARSCPGICAGTVLVLVGCRDPMGPNREVMVEVQGHYVAGFESSGFAPCDSARGWWVESTDAVPEFRRFLSTLPPVQGPYVIGTYPPPVFVRWRGVRSRKGEYGHLGAMSYKFEPRALVFVRAKGENDCASGSQR